MAESFIRLPPDSTGKKHRSWEITSGADDVHATAGVLVAEDGTVLSEPDGVAVKGLVTGNVASGDADAGNPIKVGGVAASAVSLPGVDTGDRVDATFDVFGTQRVYAVTDSGGGRVQMIAEDFGSGSLDVYLAGASATPIPTTATTEHAEDSSHASGHTGTFILAVRNDGGLNLTNADGDYSPITVDSGGRVVVVSPPTGITVNDGTGSLTVDGVVSLTGSLPIGTNAIGEVSLAAATLAALETISVANFPATQPVSVAATLATQDVRPSTAAVTSVADTASSTTLLAAAAGRLGATVFNDSTEPLFVKFGTTASATSFTVKILAGGYFEFPQPVYTGRVDGIWNADAAGSARITELTA